jgi:hypothetical protein
MRILVSLALLLAACTSTGSPYGTTSYDGPAVAEKPVGRIAGATCEVGAQCASSICEGQGCGDVLGTCADKGRPCTQDLVSFCGCDQQNFQASGSCPARRYQSRGECSTLRANATTCTTADQCTSGVCEGMGCGPEQGLCVAKVRACTYDLRTYCGCDGANFSGSGTCPGRTYASKGACDGSSAAPPPSPPPLPPPPASSSAKAPTGSACDTADQCESGICEGEGCGPQAGICAAKNRMCTRDLRPYCGCDGQTFQSSGTCAGKRYSKRGGCESAAAK